ncbi:hypothetical protein vseg_013511 [Gypsophila vaccaria]
MISFRVEFMLTLSLLLIFTNPSTSTPTPTPTPTSSCKSTTFSNNKTFDNCIELPTLKAVLYYTYNHTQSTLSIAFTARPPTPTGWIAWALNPKDAGMVGAQTLIAYKPNNTSPISINTMDIKSLREFIPGSISYNVTDTSAQESNGDLTIFATWVVPHGESSVNTVWQVGPTNNGQPGKHDFNADNLNSKMKLSLVNEPSRAPALSPTLAAPPTKSSTAPKGSPKRVFSLFMVLVATLMICVL